MKLYFACLEEWFSTKPQIESVEVEDNPDKGRYALKKAMFAPDFTTTYIRYDELETEIYPYLSGCVSRTEKGALRTLKKALKSKLKQIQQAIDICGKIMKAKYEREKQRSV